jgi:hypothetical protein
MLAHPFPRSCMIVESSRINKKFYLEQEILIYYEKKLFGKLRGVFTFGGYFVSGYNSECRRFPSPIDSK